VRQVVTSISISISIFLEEYLEWGGQVNATTRRIKMTAFSSDTRGENTSSKQLKEVARIQLDEEGAAGHLFGYTCSTLCRKWRATGLEERDMNILEHVRNKKKQNAWIRGRYRTFIEDRRWTNHKSAREEVIYAYYDLIMCNFSFLNVIGGLSAYIDDARVESAVRDIQFESSRERAKYVDKSQE